MNSDYIPPAYGDGGGCSFQAFALLGLLLIGFILFASSSLARVDLTPDTPPAYADTAAEPVLSAEAQVISIQDSPQTLDAGPMVPITGGCTDPYIVQPGDTLSEIAARCAVSLVELRQANPHIPNANLIYPGQQIHLRTIGEKISQGQVILEAPGQASPIVQIPVTGPYPTIAAGVRLHVTGVNFPTNAPVNIAIGPEHSTFTVVAAGMTDASGNIATVLTVPASTHTETTWAVVIATSGATTIQARSQPFYIGSGGS